MRFSTLFRRSTFAFASAATLAAGSLTACTDPASPDDSASARNSSSATGTAGQGTDVPLVLIALRAAADGPFRTAHGKAKFKSRGGERELEIELEDVRTGLELLFLLDDINLGTRTTDAFGRANLELNSDRGSAVPMTVAGRKVTVRTTSGATVVSGSF